MVLAIRSSGRARSRCSLTCKRRPVILVGAIRTVELDPEIKRKDFPGRAMASTMPSSQARLAMIAGLQFEAGEKAGASERLLQAMTLSRAIEAADQKIVSEIVIIRKQIECNELEAARAFLREAIALCQQQPEPLRSRSLAMLSRSQIKAGDAAGAQETIRSIREYPGLEKVYALNGLAEWYEGKGDREGAKLAYREALRCIESKSPRMLRDRWARSKKLGAIAARDFRRF